MLVSLAKLWLVIKIFDIYIKYTHWFLKLIIFFWIYISMHNVFGVSTSNLLPNGKTLLKFDFLLNMIMILQTKPTDMH